MDTLKISSSLLRGLITRIIRRNVKKKTGLTVEIAVEELEITNKDNETRIKLSLTGNVPSMDLVKYMSKELGV